MVQQNSVPVRARVGSTFPAALLLMVGTSIVVAGEICLEAELQQIVERTLTPPSQPVAPPAERELLADIISSVTGDPPVQRATGIRVIDGDMRRAESGTR
jgi:hypothetical protein